MAAMRTWCLAVVAVIAITPTFAVPATSFQESEPVTKGTSFWRGTQLDAVVGDLRTQCSRDNDAVACIKFKVLNVLDHVFKNDSFQLTESLSLVRNSFTAPKDKIDDEARSADDSDALVSRVGRYLQEHDMEVQLPGDNTLRLSPRHLDEDRVDISVSLGQRGAVAEGRGRGKLKKMMVPILVFLLLKAMTLIPLAIGVLGLKAWNALQLSFFSFVTSIALAVFQLCKKIAAESTPPPVATHVGPWEYGSHYAAARSSDVQEDAHNIAYRAH